MSKKYNYGTVAISCKVKDLLDRITEVYGLNRGAYVANLILKDAKEKGIEINE